MPTLKQTADRLKISPNELLKRWGKDAFVNNREIASSIIAIKTTWRTIHNLSQLCEKKWEDLTDAEQSLVLDGFYEAKAEK